MVVSQPVALYAFFILIHLSGKIIIIASYSFCACNYLHAACPTASSIRYRRVPEAAFHYSNDDLANERPENDKAENNTEVSCSVTMEDISSFYCRDLIYCDGQANVFYDMIKVIFLDDRSHSFEGLVS